MTIENPNEKPEDSTPSVPPVSSTPVTPPMPEPTVVTPEPTIVTPEPTVTVTVEVIDPILARDISENKIYAALSYIFILFLVPMLAAKSSLFASFHAKQGFLVFLGWVAVFVISWIPVIGGFIAFLISICLIVLSVIGLMNALKGKMAPLPFVGKYIGHF